MIEGLGAWRAAAEACARQKKQADPSSERMVHLGLEYCCPRVGEKQIELAQGSSL